MRNVEIAAWWWAEGGIRLFATIGNLFGADGREGRKLIDKAEEVGILTSKLHLPAKRMHELKQLVYVPKLDDHLRKTSNEVFQKTRVISGRHRGDSPSMLGRRLWHFAPGAGRELLEWLEHSNLVGVAWGGTLSAVIERMEERAPRPAESRAQVIPTSGEPLGSNAGEDSSSRLAARLALALNGVPGDPLSLAGMPALIPREFQNERDEIGVIRRLLDHAPAYQKIFGSSRAARAGTPPLIDRLDALVTSVGWSRSDLAETELREIGKLTNKQRALMLGDIGGALVPQPKLTASERLEFEQISALSTGLKLTHCERLAGVARESAARHHRHPTAGVIVIAIGKNKARLIHEVIRLGLVNRLICDDELARSLAAECGISMHGR
jgi:DNA-binding transcriptional regulator LsrR (DeoR family)